MAWLDPVVEVHPAADSRVLPKLLFMLPEIVWK